MMFFIFTFKTWSLGPAQRLMALPQSSVSKITNSKHPAKRTAGRQITNKSQVPIFNDQNLSERYIVWIFEFR
ncbi:MAG: hypothetical protein DRH24_12660 [Deltaproteobacteria bacterium]|nr:MAG: hypothetical protein DRH24_12660 [Deltaproteobacteria bacterium]